MAGQGRKKIRVAVVGATGVTGQQFLDALVDHPTLEVGLVAASARSAGKSYRDAIAQESGQIAWYADGPLDDAIAAMTVVDADSFDARTVDLVFSCVDAGPARELEAQYAKHCPVISTASAYRRESDVPLVLPGVNMDHVSLLARQRQLRGWKGFISPNPNCTTVGLAITLAPLYRAFGIRRVHMVSMQAVSGAGRTPGVPSMDVIDNIIPYIPGEEAKVEYETRKILGVLEGDTIKPADFAISSTCTRVGVLEGHTEVVHVELASPADEAAIMQAWRGAGASFLGHGYPSAPSELICVQTDPFRPQVRLDRDRGNGMTTSVGRLRPDAAVENGWKYLLLSHNTKMGAAKGCILVAEHLIAEGLIEGR